MNATVHTATVLDQHRAAQLDHENELLRRHAQRAADTAPSRPTGFAVVTEWISRARRVPTSRAVSAH